MANPSRPDANEPGAPVSFDPRRARVVKRVLVGVAAALLVGVAWFVWRAVDADKRDGRWDRLDAIESRWGQDNERAWLQASRPVDVDVRASHIKALEGFLAENESDAALAAHLHARLADLHLVQGFGLAAARGSASPEPHYAEAQRHLEILRDRHPDAPMNWPRFAHGTAGSLTRAAIERVAAARAWEREHASKPVEPDPDVVVVLRTDAGDLRLRTFGSVSPVAVKSFVDRICAGRLDGVRIFERGDARDKYWVRVGDERTRKPAFDDDDRKSWVDATPGEPRPPEPARYRVPHKKGIVSAWHLDAYGGDADDDPEQFLLVTKDSPALDFQYTPFARVEEGLSTSTLERIASQKTFVTDDPRARASKDQIADQLVVPVLIVRALVYEKGLLKSCHDASKVESDEAKLETLRADRYRVEPAAPPSPPSPPSAPPAPAEPAMETPPGGSMAEPPAEPPTEPAPPAK